MLDLAECLAADGEPEEAARLGSDALTLSGALVHALLVRADEVSRALQPWVELQAVSDFGSHLTDVSTRV
jgi:hypothetical protein